MSHDGSWRAACSMTINSRSLHIENHSVARGVTDPGVGSGALFGGAAKWIIKAEKSRSGGYDSQIESLDRQMREVQRV
jgi:hypothetical protein